MDGAAPDSAPAPHGAFATRIRLGLAVLVFVLWGGLLVLLCIPLLPSRKARLRLGSAFAHALGPALLAILGIRLEVENLERLRDAEPAICLINHGSMLDALVSMAIWPRHGCGIGKKEQARIPVWGLVYGIAGNLFIDRSNRERAIATMNEAVAIIRRIGISPWVAPEGTRSLDGELAPFKKGFVHLAVASRLPCVPIVMHNVFALWPAKTLRITPGTVRVEILEPIPTDDWSVETLDQHIADTRAVFVDAISRSRSAS